MPRYLTPLTIRNYSPRYNVLYQKPSIEEQVGAIKIAGRAIRNLGLNQYVPRVANTLGEISHFLTRHKNASDDMIEIHDLKKKLNPFNLTTNDKTLHFTKTNDFYHLYQDKGKQQYYLWIPAQRDNVYKMMRIKAKDDTEFKQKLLSILHNDTAQAKLECKTINRFIGKFPFMPGTEIFFNENKLTGNYELNSFDRVGREYQLENFDTKIGTVDGEQLSYYLPYENFQNYSRRNDKAVKIRDDAWLKSHTMSIFVDASTEIDEVVGNIILQTYAGKKPDPEYVAQMTRKIKNDYLYNTNGINSRGGKQRQSVMPLLSKIPLGQFGSRWQFSNDPYRGNRFWQESPMSHQELMNALYEPQADGSTVFLYDKNPEKFMALADSLSIKKVDRQYTMNYGRKAIAAKVALRLVQDELIKINSDDAGLSPEEQAKAKTKQLDLIRFQDKIFSSLGDLKDIFRKSSVGYSAYARAVANEDIPKIIEDKTRNRETSGVPSLDGFVKSAGHLHEYAENIAYIEEFWGWQFRVNLGRVLFNIFKSKIFDRDIPDVVVENAVSMFAEAVDRSSKRMKSFNEFYLKDADLASSTKTFFERIKRFDFPGAKEIIDQQKDNIGEFFRGRQSVGRTNVKRMIMQNEGVSYGREVWPTLHLRYRGKRKGAFTTNFPVHQFSWPYAERVIGNLLPMFIDMARLMKAHQEALIKNGIKPEKNMYQNNDFVYKTPEMLALNHYIQKASDNLTDKYFENNKDVFRTSPSNDVKILRKQVKTEYMNLLNVAVNVVAILSHTNESAAFGTPNDKHNKYPK